MWHSSFHAAVPLLVIHPALLFVLLDRVEVKKGERVHDLVDLRVCSYEGSLKSQFWQSEISKVMGDVCHLCQVPKRFQQLWIFFLPYYQSSFAMQVFIIKELSYTGKTCCW